MRDCGRKRVWGILFQIWLSGVFLRFRVGLRFMGDFRDKLERLEELFLNFYFKVDFVRVGLDYLKLLGRIIEYF